MPGLGQGEQAPEGARSPSRCEAQHARLLTPEDGAVQMTLWNRPPGPDTAPQRVSAVGSQAWALEKERVGCASSLSCRWGDAHAAHHVHCGRAQWRQGGTAGP